MNMGKRIGIVVTAALLLALPVAEGMAGADSGRTKGNLAETKALEIAETIVRDYGVSGVQYAIRDEGKIVLSGGIGVNETAEDIPVQKDTMFGIGSISKMHVTAATMMLVDAGKLDIDQPLVDYIPEFKMADERYKHITPRMLMNHSAGLYGSHYKNSMLFDDNDTENHDKLLESLSSERLKSDPGQYSVYANDGFQLLELLVERVSGMSYSRFLAQNINGPLGLTSTKTPLDDFNRNRLSPARFPGLDGELPAENANVIGAGGIYSTAEELTLFSDMLTGEWPDLLSEASASAMEQPEYQRGIWVDDEENTFGYGLGWDAVDLAPFSDYGIKALTKGGDTILYHSALIALPEEKVSIAVLTSGGSSILNTAAATSILLEYLLETGDISELHPDKTLPLPSKIDMPDSLNTYSGLYGTVGSTQRIMVDNEEVDLPEMMGGMIPAQTYIYSGENQFTSLDGRTAISFDDRKYGRTYLRVKSYMDFPGLGQSVIAYYEVQRLDDNPLSASVTKAWNERDGKSYYAVDEKITSLFYLSPTVLTKKITFDEQGGYASGTKIIDEDQGINTVEIPVMNGRDAFDLSFFREDGIEYLQADGRTYMTEKAVKPIYEGKASISTIPASGHARWFRIGKETAGRSMTVDLPQHGGYAVYDENGIPVNLSAATGNRTTVLPENGLIVFGGEPGEIFKVTLGPTEAR